MSYHTFQHYTFDTDLPSESPSNPELMLRELQSQLQSRQLAYSPPDPIFTNLNSLPITPWTPSTKFSKLLDNFNSSILNQFHVHHVLFVVVLCIQKSVNGYLMLIVICTLF